MHSFSPKNVKKMCSRRKLNSQSELQSFTYPRLHTGKSWYIDFLAFDPAEGKMKRKKYMLDNIPTIRERRARSVEIINSLLKLLRTGWSPWVDASASRSYTLLDKALERYEKHLEKLQREKTRQSYQSRVNILKEYNATLPIPIKYVYQFDKAFISGFLDYIYYDRESSARTRNNYRGWCSSLASFFIEHAWLTDNPAEKIKSIEETPKKRQPLSTIQLKTLKQHLLEKNPNFLLACMFEYYTFIRPSELCSVTIGDINLKEQTIYISAAVSKNKRDGKVALNNTLIKMLLSLEVFKNHSGCYLFGKKMKPSEHKGDSEQFRREWLKLRKELHWPSSLQFYSLKDSGIRDLANSEGIVIARDQARHTDVSTTNKYLKGRDLPVHNETKHFEGGL